MHIPNMPPRLEFKVHDMSEALGDFGSSSILNTLPHLAVPVHQTSETPVIHVLPLPVFVWSGTSAG